MTDDGFGYEIDEIDELDGYDVDPLAATVVDHAARARYVFGRADDLDGSEDVPTILARTDGQSLLYPAAVNLFAGEPGSCKSWLAQYEAVRIANAGDHVAYVDYESTYRSVMRRMVTLGLRPDSRARIHYPKSLGRLTREDVAMLADYCRRLEIDLIVIDGVAEALAAHGLTEDKAGEYAQWHAEVARSLARAAASCVLLLDHVPKPAQGRAQRGAEPDLYPRGSGHKLAAIDGAAYVLSMVEPLSRDHLGVVELTIAKDREGYVGPKRWKAARVTLNPIDRGETLEMTVDPPNGTGRPLPPEETPRATPNEIKLTDEFVRDVLDAATRSARRARGPVTTRAVVDELRANGVSFPDRLVSPALIRLVDRRDLTVEPGTRGARLYAPPPRQAELTDE